MSSTVILREQTFTDLPSGLSFTIRSLPDGTTLMKVEGDCLPLGNRDLIFGRDGVVGASGSAVGTRDRLTLVG